MGLKFRNKNQQIEFELNENTQLISDLISIYCNEEIHLADDLIADLYWDDFDFDEVCEIVGKEYEINFLIKNESILNFSTINDLINWFLSYIH